MVGDYYINTVLPVGEGVPVKLLADLPADHRVSWEKTPPHA